jgi:hypothetical protein
VESALVAPNCSVSFCVPLLLTRRGLTGHEASATIDTERYGMRPSEPQNYPETIPDAGGGWRGSDVVVVALRPEARG